MDCPFRVYIPDLEHIHIFNVQYDISYQLDNCVNKSNLTRIINQADHCADKYAGKVKYRPEPRARSVNQLHNFVLITGLDIQGKPRSLNRKRYSMEPVILHIKTVAPCCQRKNGTRHPSLRYSCSMLSTQFYQY